MTHTDLEARANAVILKRSYEAYTGDGELAALARHGGRAITQKLAKLVEESATRYVTLPTGKALGEHVDGEIGIWVAALRGDLGSEKLQACWSNMIDPAYGTKQTGWGWRAVARDLAERTTYAAGGKVSLDIAEDMLGWPIYRAAFTAAVTIVRYPDAANDITTDGEVVVIDIDLGGAFDTEPRNVEEKIDATGMARDWRKEALAMPEGKARSVALEMADQYDYSDEDEVREGADEAEQSLADLLARQAQS